MSTLHSINQKLTKCRQCPRLVEHCQSIAREKRASFKDWTYWGKPVPNFGDEAGGLLIVGLAPAAHGGNRTGRMFTGDNSGKWLYRSLHRTGFAASPDFESKDDGQKLKKCVITAVAHCAPPDNKPTPIEIKTCQGFLRETFVASRPRVIVALGGIAWKAIFQEFKSLQKWTTPIPKFSHGISVELPGPVTVIASYHPSQQNTFTGRLTESMLDSVFAKAQKIISSH